MEKDWRHNYIDMPKSLQSIKIKERRKRRYASNYTLRVYPYLYTRFSIFDISTVRNKVAIGVEWQGIQWGWRIINEE
jgi:hypothetical protein